MKEEEQDKKQGSVWYTLPCLVDSAPQTWLPNEWDGRMPSIVR